MAHKWILLAAMGSAGMARGQTPATSPAANHGGETAKEETVGAVLGAYETAALKLDRERNAYVKLLVAKWGQARFDATVSKMTKPESDYRKILEKLIDREAPDKLDALKRLRAKDDELDALKKRGAPLNEKLLQTASSDSHVDMIPYNAALDQQVAWAKTRVAKYKALSDAYRDQDRSASPLREAELYAALVGSKLQGHDAFADGMMGGMQSSPLEVRAGVPAANENFRQLMIGKVKYELLHSPEHAANVRDLAAKLGIAEIRGFQDLVKTRSEERPPTLD